ncbi:MAG TPA: hypothetical protein PLK32_09000 [Defluviitoga tunisiensis]|nr:hypothetical protein [Defluviitoga tunisiensis]
MIDKNNIDKNQKRENEEKTLLTFLKQVKEGEYAEVEETSLRYSRFKIQREETFYEEDEYYYSIT